MPRIAITGHMDLTSDSIDLVRRAIDEKLAAYSGSDVIGISCIAPGADSIFAEAVLAKGGMLEVILPSTNYREAKVKPDHEARFDKLVKKAREVHVMPFEEAGRAAYEAANEALLSNCDRLFAVWDGQQSKKGGTGTVVDYAREHNVPVNIIWPAGASRGK